MANHKDLRQTAAPPSLTKMAMMSVAPFRFATAVAGKVAPQLRQPRLMKMTGRSCGFSSLSIMPPPQPIRFFPTFFSPSMSLLAAHQPASLFPKVFSISSIDSLLNDLSTWFNKRTFQPSVLRKRRKTGLLTRLKSVGGRKILKRRKLKGRARLAGC